MAVRRGKPREPRPPRIEPGEDPAAQYAEPAVVKFTVRQYVLMNLLFLAFCVIQLLLARYFIRETRGLYFFFGLLASGFAAVSVFDYLYDRYWTSAGKA